MKRAIFSLMAVCVVAGLTGCAHTRCGSGAAIPGSCCNAPENCSSCGCNACDAGVLAKLRCKLAGCHGCNKCCGDQCEDYYPQAGAAPTGAVAYPYYSLRGPRDFLASNPRSLGP